MPFGKHLLTSAVESEFKQSCVIFAFYFMSFAATIHDGCRSFVAFFIMCIIWIVFMGFYLARSLCTWLLLSSHFFYEKCDFIAKILIYVGLRIRFYLFSTYNLKIGYFFRKPTSFLLSVKEKPTVFTWNSKNNQFLLEP